MSAPVARVSGEWLALRESADAAARALELAAYLDRRRPAGDRWVIHDLGCGTGSMGRWLAPLLSGPQHWIAHDRDAGLLARVAADRPGPAADRAEVTIETRLSDITRLEPPDLAGAGLITASALLDMLTEDELARTIAACVGQGCPVLLTLSVAGRVEITPSDPLDARVEAAFNDHQRRATARGRLLGPDAVEVTVERFGRLGAEVLVRPSPWRLGADQVDLTREWFTGWVQAAREQRPELAPELGAYTRRRLAQIAAGELAVTVAHDDLLALSSG